MAPAFAWSHADIKSRLIAVMLGRLRLTIEDCIEHYKELSTKAFTKHRTIHPLHAHFDTGELEKAIKSVVGPEEALKDPTPLCKV